MRGLDPRLFEQRLYVGSPEPGEGDYHALRAADVPTHPVPTLGRSVRPADDLRALASLVGAIREYRPDLIHTHTAKAGTVHRRAVSPARRRARLPIGAAAHRGRENLTRVVHSGQMSVRRTAYFRTRRGS